MATTCKVLGQINPAATTATTLYTVPASPTSAVISTITICNQNASAGSFRLAVRPGGAVLNANHYVSFDTSIAPNDTISLTLGLTLGNTDVITVYASQANMSFSAFGCEIS